jgi:UDP-2-acetamido-3-amino-2,3-dideoxy-glucuronate N-acetyltransferase
MLYDKQIAMGGGNVEVKQPKGDAVAYDATEPLQAECEHFLECVSERRMPRTPGEDGVAVLQVLQACQRSLQMNGDPVQVSGTAAHVVVAM